MEFNEQPNNSKVRTAECSLSNCSVGRKHTQVPLRCLSNLVTVIGQFVLSRYQRLTETYRITARGGNQYAGYCTRLRSLSRLVHTWGSIWPLGTIRHNKSGSYRSVVKLAKHKRLKISHIRNAAGPNPATPTIFANANYSYILSKRRVETFIRVSL